jgi:hypothetical protein
MKRLIAAALWVPLGILSVVFVLGCVDEIAEEPDQRPVGIEADLIPRPDTAFLAIISGDTVTLGITPDTLVVRRGDTIRFTMDIPGRWEVDLGADGPCWPPVIGGGTGDTAETIVRLTALPGSYKYAAAAKVGNWLVRVDPEIIVENGE